MRLILIVFLAAICGSFAKDCSKVKTPNSKLFCYYSELIDSDGCYCTHVILPANADEKTVDSARQLFGNRKILMTVNHFNQVSSTQLIQLLFNSAIPFLIDFKKEDY